MKFVKEQLKAQHIKELICSSQQNNTLGTKDGIRGRGKLPNGNDNVYNEKATRNTNNIRLQYNRTLRLLHNKNDIYEKRGDDNDT